MTSAKTKEQLNMEFKGVKYILTSSMRTKLLISLYDNSKNLDEIRNNLKKPSATILHGLKELEEVNLVKKNQKYYELTSNGYILTTNMIKLIDNWYSIDKNKIFWDSHDLTGIPESLLNKLYLLKDSQYITSTTKDLSNAFNYYINLISEVKNLNIILPIYSEKHLKYIIQFLKDEKLKHVNFVINEKILRTIKKNEFLNKNLIKSNKVTIKETENDLKVFLTISESFMSLSLFFKDGYYDDSQILVDKSIDGKKWSQALFNTLNNGDENK